MEVLAALPGHRFEKLKGDRKGFYSIRINDQWHIGFGGRTVTHRMSASRITIEAGGMMKNPFHPGEILLEEFLNPGGMTQTAFAKKIGWTRPKLNAFVKGRHGVTADSALDLAAATRTSAKFWMNLQATRDLAQAIKKRRVA